MTWRWGFPQESAPSTPAPAQVNGIRRGRGAPPSLGDDRWLCAFTALLAATVAAIPHLT